MKKFILGVEDQGGTSHWVLAVFTLRARTQHNALVGACSGRAVWRKNGQRQNEKGRKGGAERFKRIDTGFILIFTNTFLLLWVHFHDHTFCVSAWTLTYCFTNVDFAPSPNHIYSIIQVFLEQIAMTLLFIYSFFQNIFMPENCFFCNSMTFPVFHNQNMLAGPPWTHHTITTTLPKLALCFKTPINDINAIMPCQKVGDALCRNLILIMKTCWGRRLLPVYSGTSLLKN